MVSISSATSALGLIAALCAWGLFPTEVVCARPDVSAIIRHSVAANNRDWQAAPDFDYTEQVLDPKLGTSTYQVTNVFGSPYQRLIAINGKALDPKDQAQEQLKYEQMLAQRRAESPKQRMQRIAKYEAARDRDKAMLDQLTRAFKFTLQGEQMLRGHKVYVLKATPKPGYQPPNRDTQVLPGMEGELWIDENTFQWVRVEAHVIRPVSIEGFVAQVQPGTSFELEKSPVEDGIWLPSHYSMQASAKIFFLIPHHSQEEDYYFGYHQEQDASAAKRDPVGRHR